MKAKDFLKTVEKYDTIINNKLVEVKQLRHIAEGITSPSMGEKVQSSGNPQKMADAVSRYVDIEKEINSYIDKLIDAKKEVLAVIEQLDVLQYDILHKIYIQHMDFYSVAESYNKTYSWATTIHGRALKNVQNILDAQ